jgi:multiple sugar transport system ATP-binding protein
MRSISKTRNNTMGSVTLRDVHKSYGTVPVLKGINLDIADGEFVALVGASGCGKSTLLRMIAGLESITSGEISITGKVVNNAPPKERDIAMVFQNYALYPNMTVAENMVFSLRLKKAPMEERKAAVAKAAAVLNLGDLLDRYPRELSGGQRQRVAMGRAIVRDPQVFLFDEPLSNLDAKLRVHMRSEIKELHQRLGTTMIYVTHDQIEAMTMADRIVVMNGGVIEQAGAPLEIYDSPKNTYVAGFIGSPAMNLFEATIIDVGTEKHISLGGGVTLPLPPGFTLHAGTTVQCGIRPEHLVPAADGVPARVIVTEPTGSETQFTLRLGDQTMVCLVRERMAALPGGEIQVAVEARHIHVFDRNSGLALS